MQKEEMEGKKRCISMKLCRAIELGCVIRRDSEKKGANLKEEEAADKGQQSS